MDKDACPAGVLQAAPGGLRILHAPDHVVVDLVLFVRGLHVDGAADRDNVGDDVARYPAVDIAYIQPEPRGMTAVPDDVVPKQHVPSPVELDPAGLPTPLG